MIYIKKKKGGPDFYDVWHVFFFRVWVGGFGKYSQAPGSVKGQLLLMYILYQIFLDLASPFFIFFKNFTKTIIYAIIFMLKMF